jgi:transmembrane sensor
MTRSNSTRLNQEIRAEAAAWLARLHADDRSESDERAFQIWLSASATHATAFEAANLTWEAVGGIPFDLRGEREARPSHVVRRTILLGLGAICVLGGTFTFWQSAEARIYQTDIGEQKHIILEDGSQLFLDTNTRVVVNIDKRLRSAELQYGRANFRVTADANRPFIVSAAARKIVASQSSFDVRRDGERVSIILINGHASVVLDSVAQGDKEQQLSSGERLVATDAKTVIRDKPKMAPLLAWQVGQAVFENERLIDATNEMNRYSTVKLEIDDSGIASLRLSGVYTVGDNLGFANSISMLLPVKVRSANNLVYLERDASRFQQRASSIATLR